MHVTLSTGPLELSQADLQRLSWEQHVHIWKVGPPYSKNKHVADAQFMHVTLSTGPLELSQADLQRLSWEQHVHIWKVCLPCLVQANLSRRVADV